MPALFENGFERIGRSVAHRPWTHIFVAVVIGGACAGGYPRLESENRPDKQWVPRGAKALDHKEYTESTWPSTERFNFWIAKCKGEGCNALDAVHVRELNRVYNDIMSIEVSQKEVRDIHSLSGESKSYEWSALTEEQWKVYEGTWSFDYRNGTKKKCSQFGPFCGKRSPLEIYRNDDAVISELTDAESLGAFNFWESQTNMCPLTIARPNSPCVNTTAWMEGAEKLDCQNYDTPSSRQNCREASDNYCADVCPTMRAGPTCGDNGCPSLRSFANLAESSNGTAPDTAFAFEPFKIRTVASSGDGPVMEGSDIVSAEAYFGFFAIGATSVVVNGNEVDPVSLEWEKRALCEMGIKVDDLKGVDTECPESPLFDFKAQFTRSLSDEFGNAIRGDIGALGASYVLIIIYMAIMLSRQDHVHSMVYMSLVTILCVGLSYIGSMGLGGYFGLMNNNLNAQIPFLLLGLGVDDAFVLTSEFVRATKKNPTGSIEDRMGAALRGGGMSILITSATDALAFFFGSITVLPALHWFCIFAGMGIILCFLFQILLFVPFLVLNERRAKANRYDLSCFPLGLCCWKANPTLDRACCIKPPADNDTDDDTDRGTHHFEKPLGCCFCCRGKGGMLEKFFEKFARTVTTKIGKIVTLIIFTAILAAGIAGASMIEQDFKLEWFVPDDSYVNTMFKWNAQYFKSGTPVTIYGKQIDYFTQQNNLIEIGRYLDGSDLVDHEKPISNWFDAFIDTVSDDENNAEEWLTEDGTEFKDETTFYRELHAWYSDGVGARFRSSLKWTDPNCDDSDNEEITAQCDPTMGISAMKIGCTLTLQATDEGPTRYLTMQSMRADVEGILQDAFPYSFEFLYWEEAGVIGKELVQNLLSCLAVIVVIICVMIPHPRIAPWVILGILYTTVNLIGFMHWWDITVSGVSTVYILISVGLAVDYAAHVAHMFADSTGKPEERAVKALVRIGPSVFNAICSTMLAVVVLGTSKSYIFRVFFKALFLTVILGGAVGLWLLPVVLSIVGGSKDEVEGEDEGAKEDEAARIVDEKDGITKATPAIYPSS